MGGGVGVGVRTVTTTAISAPELPAAAAGSLQGVREERVWWVGDSTGVSHVECSSRGDGGICDGN